MILALCAAIFCGDPVKVADYFPTAPGTTWEYEEVGYTTSKYTDKALAKIEMGGSDAYPIETTRDGQSLGINYYRVNDDGAFLLGYKPKEPFSVPHPILKLSDKSMSWSFKGATPVNNALLPFEFVAKSSPMPAAELFGQKRDRYRVEMDATIDEAGGIVKIKVKQSIVYAKGIGMVEMTETAAYTRTQNTRTVKLKSFQPGTTS